MSNKLSGRKKCIRFIQSHDVRVSACMLNEHSQGKKEEDKQSLCNVIIESRQKMAIGTAAILNIAVNSSGRMLMLYELLGYTE